MVLLQYMNGSQELLERSLRPELACPACWLVFASRRRVAPNPRLQTPDQHIRYCLDAPLGQLIYFSALISGSSRRVASGHIEARIPPLPSHRLRALQPFRAERKARKHEAGLRVPALVLEAWSLRQQER
jgi:hypothetical protein